MQDSFYDIKPLEQWLKKESGLIYQNEDAFVSLNIVPSVFGHSLVIPKKKIYSATELSPTELWNLQEAKEKGLEQLQFIVYENPDHIFDMYNIWSKDETLNSKLPCKERIQSVLKDVAEGIFNGHANVFENIGEDAGQMIKHYHMQILPRFRNDLKGGGQAFFEYLHK